MKERSLFTFFIFFIYPTYVTTIHSLVIPRLSPISRWQTNPTPLAASDTDHVKTFYYKQNLDNFNYMPESYTKFQQRYMINFKFWGGANSSAPIFVCLGGEASIDSLPMSVGFLTDNAASFNALLVYIEHRYYGKSLPFGSREKTLKNASTIGYFNSAQAITNYAKVLVHVKKTLHAKKSPVIVVGGSYAGMLATWFRLKYPHPIIGALASSAPILYFDNIFGPLDNSHILKDHLTHMYTSFAQFNSPPIYPVNVICGGGIDGTPIGSESDILSKISAGLVAFFGNSTCKINGGPIDVSETETRVGWRWQTCSEMVMPLEKGNDTMFEPAPFNLKLFAKGCKKQFGVSPRPHWITSYYGGHDIKLVLKRFGSNIIFSNGLKDPYSSGGVLNNISDSLIALHTVNGSHCLDILRAYQDDPEWLVQQRKKEVEIIKGWITQYYADLDALGVSE